MLLLFDAPLAEGGGGVTVVIAMEQVTDLRVRQGRPPPESNFFSFYAVFKKNVA